MFPILSLIGVDDQWAMSQPSIRGPFRGPRSMDDPSHDHWSVHRSILHGNLQCSLWLTDLWISCWTDATIPASEKFIDLRRLVEMYRIWNWYINTVQCCYNRVNFLTNIHKRHPITRPLGRGMGSLLWIQNLIFCLNFCNYTTRNKVILDSPCLSVCLSVSLSVC